MVREGLLVPDLTLDTPPPPPSQVLMFWDHHTHTRAHDVPAGALGLRDRRGLVQWAWRGDKTLPSSQAPPLLCRFPAWEELGYLHGALLPPEPPIAFTPGWRRVSPLLFDVDFFFSLM